MVRIPDWKYRARSLATGGRAIKTACARHTIRWLNQVDNWHLQKPGWWRRLRDWLADLAG